MVVHRVSLGLHRVSSGLHRVSTGLHRLSTGFHQPVCPVSSLGEVTASFVANI